MVRKRLRPMPRTSVLVRKPAPSKARRNAQDATLRNVRSAKAAIAELRLRVRQLEKSIKKFNAVSPSLQVRCLIDAVSKLQTKTDSNTRALRFLYESANFTQMRRQKGRKR